MPTAKMLPVDPLPPPPDIQAKARRLRADIRAACSMIDSACSDVQDAANQLAELGGPAEPEPTSAGAFNPKVAEVEFWKNGLQAWLDRQRVLGLISAEGATTVEKLIAEVG